MTGHSSRPLPAGIQLDGLVDGDEPEGGIPGPFNPLDGDPEGFPTEFTQITAGSAIEAAGAPEAAAGRKVGGIMSSWEGIGLPLLIAVLTRGGAGPIGDRLETVGGLIAAVTRVVEHLAEVAGALPEGGDDWVRWKSAVLAAEVVAASFLEVGEVPGVDQADELARRLGDGLKACEGIPVHPTPWPAQVRAGRAIVPVVVAVGRYAFGRAQPVLLSEVVSRLRQLADDAAKATGAEGDADTLASFLMVLGQLYSLAHHGETDRLLALPPAERDALAARAPGGLVDMAVVWAEVSSSFELVVGVAEHIRLPAGSVVDGPAWA